MMTFIERNFNRLFFALSGLMFLVICLRAWMIPFSHDEAATFFYYIQSDNYLPFRAHVYTNNHVLNSALANLFYHVGGSHRFVLRLPNVLSFIVFCYGVFRHFRHYNSSVSRLLPAIFFLLSFQFLDFFELCRGYGISIAFMTLGLSYLSDYLQDRDLKSFRNFSICWQLALAANLILVVVLAVLLAFIGLYQYRIRQLFVKRNILIQSVNLFLLLFWVAFSFFYKEKGVLDYGVGEDYWGVTFKTLIYILFGSDARWLQYAVAMTAAFVLGLFFYRILRNSFFIDHLFKPQLAYPFLLVSLVAAFYIQKKLLNVNYPEDRTGLFFFLFFVFSLAYSVEVLPRTVALAFSGLAGLFLIWNFVVAFSFTNFSTWFYHTLPKSMYDQLMQIYESEKTIFTIGGHRVRELNFAFMNYRGGAVLNHMDNSEEMQMNCDYYIAMRREKPYYDAFYEEIGYDRKWDRALLKRKEKIGHRMLWENYKAKEFSGSHSFFDFLLIRDTAFASRQPVEIDAGIEFREVPKPFNAFCVLSVENEAGEQVWYKRVPLNWLAMDLNGQTKYIKLTTGNLPDKIKKLSVHIWNIEGREVRFVLKSLRLYQLQGRGVDFRIPKEFYPMIENVTKKPLL